VTGELRHVPPARFDAYWAGALSDAEQEALERHVYQCDACAAAWQRAAGTSPCLRAVVGPIVDGG
jgi:anti-sigma factor RsiW